MPYQPLASQLCNNHLLRKLPNDRQKHISYSINATLHHISHMRDSHNIIIHVP